MPICTICGINLQQGSKFCSQCGSKIEDIAVPSIGDKPSKINLSLNWRSWDCTNGKEANESISSSKIPAKSSQGRSLSVFRNSLTQLNWNKIKGILTAIAAICAIITFIYSFYPGAPGPMKHQLLDINSTDEFQIKEIRDVSGKLLKIGDRFSYRTSFPSFFSGVPISISGISLYNSSSSIWVVLRDIYGDYYLQSPSVSIKDDGTWKATNILPLNNISEILFITVGQNGYSEFMRKANADDWGGFAKLPVDNQKLGWIELLY